MSNSANIVNEPTWHKGMYGCREDMFSRSRVDELLAAERERIARAISRATLPRDIWNRPSVKAWFIEGVTFAESVARGATSDDCA